MNTEVIQLLTLVGKHVTLFAEFSMGNDIVFQKCLLPHYKQQLILVAIIIILLVFTGNCTHFYKCLPNRYCIPKWLKKPFIICMLTFYGRSTSISISFYIKCSDFETYRFVRYRHISNLRRQHLGCLFVGFLQTIGIFWTFFRLNFLLQVIPPVFIHLTNALLFGIVEIADR